MWEIWYGGGGMEDRTIWRGPQNKINSSEDQKAMAFGASSSIFLYSSFFVFQEQTSLHNLLGLKGFLFQFCKKHLLDRANI
jgi:hypothetical protein